MPLELEELRKLTIAEKLHIVEQLWDDIGTSTEPFPIQDWHTEEAQRRASELAAQPEIALTREELWRRVDAING